jgi:photosystem II stability/assembly factor-like uncharacterized protein
MLQNETRQKQKSFTISQKISGILAMRKFILPVIILLLPVISFAQSGWYVQNSSTANNLNDIFFINQNTGWAVGDNGTIVKTTNGGFSWYNQSSGTSLVLRKVQFINSNSGWIVGGNFNSSPNPFCEFSSVRLKTTNGGQNWAVQQTTSLGIQYNDISMVDSSVAFIAGESMDNFQCIMGIGSIGKTTNGGTEWNGISYPISTGYINKSVSFINSFTGYVSALHSSDVMFNLKKILKTTNGGINWTIKTTDSSNGFSAQNNFIRFFNENTGYYINGNFSRTTNSGDNWTKFDSLSVYGMNKFSFLNLNTGYLVGQNKLVKTFNGGTNFITNSGNTFTGLNSICAVDTNHVWACGAGGKIVYGGIEIVADTVFAKYVPLKVGNSWTYIQPDPLVNPGIYYKRNTVFKDSIINGHQYFYTNAFEGLNWVRYDSLTTNLLKYSPGNGCSSYPNDQIIDSLRASIGNNIPNCGLYTIRKCQDTTSYNLFNQSIVSKSFLHDGLATNSVRYGKNFGVLQTISPYISPIYAYLNLKGCVLDGVVYGDTSVFSPYKAYLPLQVGNSWTYRDFCVFPYYVDTTTVTITSESTIGGIKYFTLSERLPTIDWNVITLDTITGNIFGYNASSSCTRYPNRELLDSLNAKKGDTIRHCPSLNPFGRCVDTALTIKFGSIIKTKSFNYLGGSYPARTYSEKFGLIFASTSEIEFITHTLISCTINGVNYSDSLKSISGTVKFSDNNQPVTGGYVKALKLNTSTGNIITSDSVQIGPNGDYILNNVPSDLYYIVAYPNSEKQSDFVPTYFPSTINWQTAVKVNSANNPSNINIGVFRKTEMSGSYSVNGWITTQTNSYAGIKDAVIYIKQGNIFRDYFITQNTGQYNLKSLLSGNYEIIADRLGYVSASQNVSVTNGNLENVNFALVRVGVQNISNIIPDKYSLYQNYPNPFNPVTNIKFDVPKSSLVTIKVYNILGKEAAILLNEVKSAGRYELDFDASTLTSGVYFYRIETDGFTETKRMVILK